MTDRELFRQALEALELIDESMPFPVAKLTVKNLRKRLAQPDAYGYALRLAVAIWEQHYKDVAPQWKPLDDLMGVLTQIDNMTVGLTRLAQPEQEPVAWVAPSWLNPETRTWESESFAPGPINGWIPLYTAPRQWQGLTDEERNNLWRDVIGWGDPSHDDEDLMKAIEAKLKEKNT